MEWLQEWVQSLSTPNVVGRHNYYPANTTPAPYNDYIKILTSSKNVVEIKQNVA